MSCNNKIDINNLISGGANPDESPVPDTTTPKEDKKEDKGKKDDKSKKEDKDKEEKKNKGFPVPREDEIDISSESPKVDITVQPLPPVNKITEEKYNELKKEYNDYNELKKKYTFTNSPAGTMSIPFNKQNAKDFADIFIHNEKFKGADLTTHIDDIRSKVDDLTYKMTSEHDKFTSLEKKYEEGTDLSSADVAKINETKEIGEVLTDDVKQIQSKIVDYSKNYTGMVVFTFLVTVLKIIYLIISDKNDKNLQMFFPDYLTTISILYILFKITKHHKFFFEYNNALEFEETSKLKKFMNMFPFIVYCILLISSFSILLKYKNKFFPKPYKRDTMTIILYAISVITLIIFIIIRITTKNLRLPQTILAIIVCLFYLGGLFLNYTTINNEGEDIISLNRIAWIIFLPMCLLTMGYIDFGTKLLASVYLVCMSIELLLNGTKNMNVITRTSPITNTNDVKLIRTIEKLYFVVTNNKATLQIYNTKNKTTHNLLITLKDKKLIIADDPNAQIGIDTEKTKIDNLYLPDTTKNGLIYITIHLQFKDKTNYATYKDAPILT